MCLPGRVYRQHPVIHRTGTWGCRVGCAEWTLASVSFIIWFIFWCRMGCLVSSRVRQLGGTKLLYLCLVQKDVMSCRLADMYQHFRGTMLLKTWVTVCQSAWWNIVERLNIQVLVCLSVPSDTVYLFILLRHSLPHAYP